MRGLPGITLGVAAALLSGAGCAGSNVSREAFAADANSVCRGYNAKIDAKPRPGVLEQFQDYTDEVLPLMRDTRDRIGDLERPDELERDVEQLLARWDDIIDAAEGLRQGAAAGSDIEIVIGRRKMGLAELQADSAARAAGVPDCVGFNPFSRR